jgi:predicted Zn finger-like uncharacterized protein
VSFFDSRNDYARRSASTADSKIPSTCPACRSASISTTAKSPDASSYWRCERCGEVWNVSRRDPVRYGAHRWR